MGYYPVTIDLVRQGNSLGIVCSPHRVYVERGADVEWLCPGGHPFAVDFGWNSPFSAVSFSAQKGGSTKVAVPNGAAFSKYEYFVALYDASTGLVYTLDPEMIIKR